MSNVALFAVLFGKKGDKARLVPRVGAYNNLQFHTAAYTFAITSAVWPAARCPATRSQKNRCVRVSVFYQHKLRPTKCVSCFQWFRAQTAPGMYSFSCHSQLSFLLHNQGGAWSTVHLFPFLSLDSTACNISAAQLILPQLYLGRNLSD